MPAFLRVFGFPILFAALSLLGLLSALVGDGAWDVLSWFTLGAAPAWLAWAMLRAPKDV